MKKSSFLLILLSFLASLPAAAQNPPPIEAKLISATTAVGSSATAPLALEIIMPQHWHTYWRTPGIAGLPPSMTFDIKDNVDEVKILYPAPQRLVEQDAQSFVYMDRVVFPLDVKLTEAGKAMKLKGHVDIVMCEDICVPANAPIEIALDAGVGAPSPDAELVQNAIAALPRSDENVNISSITRKDATLEVALNHPAGQTYTDMLVEAPNGIMLKQATVTPREGGSLFKAEFDTPSEAPQIDGKDLTLTFIGAIQPIELTGSEGGAFDSDGDGDAIAPMTDEGASDMPPVEMGGGESLPYLILIALLGGLILNLMPCVLPVLSLKLLTIISHAGSDSAAKIRRGFVASVLGILTSFWIIAAGVIALKETGMALGWGLQFQHPVFIGAMIAIILMFAANMFGLFEFRLPYALQSKLGRPQQGGDTLAKEYLTGMFAALLATPCSAPFVGTAVTFALSNGVTEILVIFTALGFGLALPYLLVAIWPRLAQHLPRPGAWMTHLRVIMGLLLLGTAVWLGTVLVAQLSPTAPSQADSNFAWQEFAPDTIAAQINDGKVVFVNITADWCLTCHVNKARVINAEPVRSALKQDGIVLMQADWTRPNENIQNYLRSYNRFGIPFNIVFGPGMPEGILLPELLDADIVMSALDMAKTPKD